MTAQRNSKGPSTIHVFSDHAEIELCDRKDHVVAVAVIDKDDAEAVSGKRWYKSSRGYAAKSASNIYLHSFLMPDAVMIDFKDGDKLNCRRENLRSCTPSQNAANAKKRVGASGFRGVSYQARSKRWYASIYHNMKRIRLGGFDSPEEAAMAYNRAALEYYGEFATLNNIGSLEDFDQRHSSKEHDLPQESI